MIILKTIEKRHTVRRFFLGIATILLPLSVCGCGSAAGTHDDGVNDDLQYTEKQVNVYRSSERSENIRDGQITLRFYEDQPNVPYVSIKDYYATVLKNSKEPDVPKMQVTKQEDGTYLLRSGTGEAVVDVEADVLTTDDITGLINQMSLVGAGLTGENCDTGPFLAFAGAEYEKKEVSYDMGKYEIDVRGEEDDVYFPVATISDLTSDPDFHYTAYNGENFYFCENPDAYLFSDHDSDYYNTRLKDAAKGGTRQKDLIEFSYNELCFNIDHFYGKPGKEYIHEDLEKGGLAYALQELGKPGKKIIELLKSDSYADYFAGIAGLQKLLGDGGHTSLKNITNSALSDEELMDAYFEVKEETDTLLDDMDVPAANLEWDEQMMYARAALRENMLHCGEETYVKQGDTAVCILDTFQCEITDLWEDYYAGNADKPAMDNIGQDRIPDSVLIVRDALDRASADPEVKNFILDISNNGGGLSDEMLAVFAMLTGSSTVSMKSENVYAGVIREETFRADCNLDKVIDSKDDKKPDLNIGILTSRSSYSCGSMLPVLMKDAGYKILGEQSGGGTCCVGAFGTPEGFLYTMSSARCRLTDQAGISHDDGIPVDVDLLPKDQNGAVKNIEITIPEDPNFPEDGDITVTIPDYTEFYNLERLSKEMCDD
ncbi:MAG: hypothetical protein IJI10_03335 [Eubacterium sp.]|nr:hypothetical protein [Eubacterium sp.]